MKGSLLMRVILAPFFTFFVVGLFLFSLSAEERDTAQQNQPSRSNAKDSASKTEKTNPLTTGPDERGIEIRYHSSKGKSISEKALIENLQKQLDAFNNRAPDSARLILNPSAAYLGVSLRNIPPSMSQGVSLPYGSGLLVMDIKKGSAAASAQLRSGDVLYKMDGQVMVNVDQFITLGHHYKPGQKATLTYVRDKKILTATATFAKRPPQSPSALSRASENQVIQRLLMDWYTLHVDPIAQNGENTQYRNQRTHVFTTKDHTYIVHGNAIDTHVKISDRKGTIIYDGPYKNAPAEHQTHLSNATLMYRSGTIFIPSSKVVPKGSE